MAPRISLALALHNHQPVGNFGWVIAENCETAYLPMLDALDRHPGVRLSLHYTGPLLEWFAVERPEILDRIRALVARDQVEILGGGYYEPVLASLPERDRVGQLERMGDVLEATFGRRPRGAWLAERVWEPDLPISLAAGGYGWTILDDAHFRAAAIPEADLWGPYTTEDQGHPLDVFGTEQGLRYRIPFRDVEEVIGYLRDHATEDGSRVGTMGDDGEKFGAWPSTWDHCWGADRWVERFFEALEANADWITTVTPSLWLDRNHPIGRVYIPTGSYAEMGAWALPPDESVAFAAMLHRAQAEDLPEARWLRGASWRNFQVKYREVNDLHKQMLRVSDKVAQMTPGPDRDLARTHLYRGQSNDCYWHGVFGGIYISHMRLATYEHLIAAEDLADAGAVGGGPDGSRTIAVWDLDKDGFDEVQLSEPGQVVTIDLEDGAGIGSWDLRATRHAALSVLRRRPEAYHARLRALEAPHADGESHGDAAATSIHDIVRTTEPGLSARLWYDDHERRSGLVRFLPVDATAEGWARAEVADLGDAMAGPYELVEAAAGRAVMRRLATVAGAGQIRVTKTITLGGGRLDPSLDLRIDLEHLGPGALEARVGIEWTITMLGGGGNPSAWLEIGGTRTGHDQTGSADDVARFAQGNDVIGIHVTTAVTPAADAWWSPVETISNSEQGFERVYQGSGQLVSWPLRLEPGERWTATVTHAVASSRDRRADEG